MKRSIVLAIILGSLISCQQGPLISLETITELTTSQKTVDGKASFPGKHKLAELFMDTSGQ